MRLLDNSNDPEFSKKISELLTDRGIKHQMDTASNTDWGDDKYGEINYRIWIYDEDDYDKALDLLNLYKTDPKSDAVKLTRKSRSKNSRTSPFKMKNNEKVIPLIPDPPFIPEGPNRVTRFVTLLCCLLFLLQTFTTPSSYFVNSSLYVPSSVNQWLLYDYPKAAELYTKVISLWGPQGIENIPSEGKVLLQEAVKTPVWPGFYDISLEEIEGKDTHWQSYPWFEKIKLGEFWRLFTPALIHANLLHILFNLLWFWMLGKEIEKTLGPNRFVVLILIIAIGSNTLQYLMTGFEFLGLSGVVAGLLFFIGERQRIAPWEGYTLQKSVYYFLLIYIFGLAALQSLSFLLALFHLPTIPLSIANTAHVSGAAIGFLLGRLSIFAWKG